MALEIDESILVVGQIEIALIIDKSGDTGKVYGFEGMSVDEAIGHMTVVLDRLREERSYQWDSCACGHSWDEEEAE